MLLFLHSAEAIKSCGMTCDVMIVTNRRGGPEMFLEAPSKCSCRLINVFNMTLNPGMHVSVDHLTLLCNGISLGGHQEVFDGSTFIEVYLFTILVTDILDTLPEPLGIWDYHAYVVLPGISGLFLLLVLLEGLFWELFLIFNLVSAQVRYLHLFNASLRCYFFFL